MDPNALIVFLMQSLYRAMDLSIEPILDLV
jgi:hypothetical protein